MNKGFHVLERRKEWREEMMNTRREDDIINPKMEIYNSFQGEYTLTYHPLLWKITQFYRKEDYCGRYANVEYLSILNQSCEYRRMIYNYIIGLPTKKNHKTSKLRETSWMNIRWLCHTEIFFEKKMKENTLEIFRFYSCKQSKYDLLHLIYQKYSIYPTAIANSKQIKYPDISHTFSDYYVEYFEKDKIHDMMDIFMIEYIEYIDGLLSYIQIIESSLGYFMNQCFTKSINIQQDIYIQFGYLICEIIEFHKKVIKIVLEIIYYRIKNKCMRHGYPIVWINHILQKYEYEHIYQICNQQRIPIEVNESK